MYEKIAKWYKQGLWNAGKVADALKKGILTQEQYEEITAKRD